MFSQFLRELFSSQEKQMKTFKHSSIQLVSNLKVFAKELYHLLLLIKTDNSTLCPCHVTYMFQSKSTLWLNGWVFVYELSGCGFESSCTDNSLSKNPEALILDIEEIKLKKTYYFLILISEMTHSFVHFTIKSPLPLMITDSLPVKKIFK